MKKNYKVAIVGKPNSGKSTIFNRIVGARKAITHKTPGVTRDVMESTASWNGKAFDIIDTGGFIFSKDDPLQKEIKKRILDTAAQADVIIFLVDSRTGPTSEDLALLKGLRDFRSKVICAVNKVENQDEVIEISDFYSLGFELLFPISAIHGRGVGDLLDEVTSKFPARIIRSTDDSSTLKITILGKPNVGKSSIINRLLGDERHIVSEEPGTTRDTINLHLRYHGQDVVIVDTAGIRRKSRKDRGLEGLTSLKSIRSVEEADIVVAVIDASENMISKQDTRVISIGHRARKGILILFNKWDLIEKEGFSYGVFEKMVRKAIPFVNYAPIISVSAKTGTRIGKIIPKCFEIQKEREKKIPTAKLNKLIEEFTLSTPPSFYKGGTGKIFYATQTGVKPPTFTLFVNNPLYFPRSYKRYINNQLRKLFTFEGTTVRILMRSRER